MRRSPHQLTPAFSSSEVVSLVGGFFSGVKGTVPKTQLSALVPTTVENAGLDGKSHHRQDNSKGTWAFVDDNVSSHLIRNALGGGEELELRRSVSIPAPHSRRFRDDITVTVVWWEEDGKPFGSRSDPSTAEITLKAKL